MVRQGDFELLLVRPGTFQAFEEVQGSGGEAYAVAAAGEAYEVQVVQHHGAQGLDRTLCQASLEVDGINLGYSYTLSSPGTRIFKGFLLSTDAGSTSYEGFVFSKPAESATKQATGLNFAEGKIVCKVYRAGYTGGQCAPTPCSFPASTNESIAPMPEGKKFFMAPSLTTGKGELKLGAGFAWQQVARLHPFPVATLTLRYETATALLLRGVLRRDELAHRAILQQFPETAEGEAAATGGPGAGAAPQRRRAQQAGSQQAEAPGAARAKEEAVDLTGAANDADEVLRANRQGKVLECDLTADSDDEEGGGRWRAVKRAAR